MSAALFALAGVGLCAIALLLLAAPPGRSIGALVGDDAGYYFAIARNACLGYGFSFDRIHATNGFNPLFPWILIPLYHLLPRGLPLEGCYRIGVLVDLVAVAGAWVLFLRLLSSRLEQDGWASDLRRLMLAAASAFFVLFIGTKGTYGMDAPLVLALGIAYLVRVQRRGPLAPGPAPAAIDGLLLALLFLARVDTLPLLAAAFAVMAIEVAATRRGLAALATRLAVVVAACAPYLVWSIATFGTWMPVSARIKSGFPVVDLARSLATIRHTSLGIQDQASFLVAWLAAWAVLAAYAPKVVAALRTRAALAPATSALLLFALYLAGRLTFMLLFSRADVQGSYAVLAHVFNVVVAATLVGVWMRRATPARARQGAALASLALAAVALVLFAGKLSTGVERARTAAREGLPDEMTFGAELHDLTGEGDVLFGGSCGLLGFFTDRPWINDDGVVNTYAYQRMFLAPEGALARYFRTNRVTHVVFEVRRNAVIPAGPMQFDAHGLLYGRISSITLDPSDIVLRRPMSRGTGGGADMVLARVRLD